MSVILAGPDAPQPGNGVGDAAGLQVVESGQFVGGDRHDQLAAPLVPGCVCSRYSYIQPGALDARRALSDPGW